MADRHLKLLSSKLTAKSFSVKEYLNYNLNGLTNSQKHDNSAFGKDWDYLAADQLT